MRYRKLGNTNIDVSVICLGTMTFGEQNSEKDGFEQMDYAIDRGVNFIDTAEMYAVPTRAETYGKTEEIVGNWIKSKKIKEIESYIEESIVNLKTFKDISVHLKTDVSSIDLTQDNNDYPSIFKNKVFDSNLDEIYFGTSEDNIFIAKTNIITFPENDGQNQGINLSSELRSFFGAEIVKNKNISTNDNLIQALISQY